MLGKSGWKAVPALILLLVLLQLFPAQAVSQVKSELELLLDSGKTKYGEFDFEGAISVLTRVIDTIESRIAAGTALSDDEKKVFSQALTFRALANLDLAREDAGKSDFRRLIQFAPGYELTTEFASQLYLDLYSSLKKQMVGFVKLKVSPDAVELEIDNSPAGIVGEEPVAILAGEHALKLSKRGYATDERQVVIEAGKTAELEVALPRTQATVFLRTSPPGAEVLLDGEVVGVTSGMAGSDFSEKLAELGLRAEDVSAEFAIKYLELGTHQLTVRKECFTIEQRMLEVPAPEDYWLNDPLMMQPSKGTLRLNNLPKGAEVLINGLPQERDRTQFGELCSGEYQVEVRHAGGSFHADVVISKDLETEVEVRLLPALAFIGVEYRGQLESDQRANAQRRLSELFSRITRFRILNQDDKQIQELLNNGSLKLADFARLLEGGVVSERAPDDLYRSVRESCRILSTNLLCVAVFQEKRLGTRFRLFVFGTQGPFADSFVIDIDDSRQIERALQRMDYPFSLQQSWLGITAVDTLLYTGPAVIAVQEGSPAGEAGVAIGEEIVAIEGNPVSGYRGVIEALSKKRPGEEVSLDFKKAGTVTTRTIVLGRSPVLLPLFSQSFNYNSAIADLSLMAALNPGTELEQLAVFNIGLAMAHFGAWEDAIVYLRRVNLGDRPGINQGTVEYYLGICYESLGYKAEALSHYQSAFAYESATLVSNDGPLVAPRIKQKVQQLEEKP
jgi:tetratricopeptide (TPR) repeat protein